jgi:hypothetical protein
MRISFVFSLLFAFPAHAWEATIGTICTLSHETMQAEIVLTYDPSKPVYSITVTRKGTTWAPAPIFGMAFADRAPNRITTPMHRLSDDNRALTVTDRGFGNVLDGLQFNDQAIAFLGDQSISFELDGAAPEVQAFRECRPIPLA